MFHLPHADLGSVKLHISWQGRVEIHGVNSDSENESEESYSAVPVNPSLPVCKL